MTFKTNLTNDLDVFFNSDEFAVDVTYNAVTIQGIFDDEFIATAEREIGVEDSGPQVLVKTSDVVGASHKETMTINSVVYNIIGIHPDGTGMTLILLSED